MNVIDIRTRRPVGQQSASLVEMEILDGFPEYERPDDIVTVEIRGPASALGEIIPQIDTTSEAFAAAWSSCDNVIDFQTGEALVERQATCPEIIDTDDGVLVESYVRRDQAAIIAQLVAKMNRAAVSLAS